MPKIIVLVGPPGSGKSTLAKKYVAEGFVYVNQDSQKGDHIDICQDAIYAGKIVLVDRMNFDKKQRERYLGPARLKGYETEIQVLHVPHRVCLERAILRKDHETIKDEKSARQAVDFFFKNYERVTDDEADVVVRHYCPEVTKIPCLISDLDGTLCNCEHRRHFVRRTDGGKKDWHGFFKGMADDTVNEPVMEVLKRFRNSHAIVYSTGRPDDWKKTTKEWFEKHGAPEGEMFMRMRHDSREDSIVKEIMLDFEILTRYTPFMVLDDRDQVVKMWRRRGIPTMQVNEGDF